MIFTLEIGIFLLVFLSLIAFVSIWPTTTVLPLFLIGLAGCLVAVHLSVFHFRWQMIPALSVVAFLLIGYFLGWELSRAAGLVGAGIGTVFLALSAALSLGFPARALPAPDGPHGVGVVTIDREYASGGNAQGDPTRTRRLQLKVWYPATIDNENKNRRETLWNEFNSPESFSAVERFFASYLKNIRTHSYNEASIALGGVDRPVLIYNHALLSIASENSLLAESLASHGYVIVGIRHKDQRSEYALLQNSLSNEEKAEEVANLKKLGNKGLDRRERAALSKQVYQENKTMPAIVRRRAEDTGFVLDNLASILSAIPGCAGGACVDENRIGLVGLSLGGAVATEFCKTDLRCSALVNLDGGLFGTDITAPVETPYLMLYSERNEGGNDFAKTVQNETYQDHAIPGAEHANFHDASVVLPGLKYIGLLGPIDGYEMNRQRNRLVREFLDERLKRPNLVGGRNKRE